MQPPNWVAVFLSDPAFFLIFFCVSMQDLLGFLTFFSYICNVGN